MKIKFTNDHGQPTEVLINSRKDKKIGCEATIITPGGRKVAEFEWNPGTFIYEVLRLLKRKGVNFEYSYE